MSRMGRYRHYMQIQSQGTPTRGASGQPIPSWTTVANVWAGLDRAYKGEEILAGTPSEALMPLQVSYNYVWIEIRYRESPVFTSQHRIVYGSRIFEIIAVQDPTGRQEELSFLCRETQ